MRRVEVIGKGLFVLDSRHVRIAFLDFAEQAFFCSKNRARSVGLDRTTFQDDPGALRKWVHLIGVADLCHQAADLFVVPPVGILRPSVKPELQREQCALSG
jgi:hypothetical protein